MRSVFPIATLALLLSLSPMVSANPSLTCSDVFADKGARVVNQLIDLRLSAESAKLQGQPEVARLLYAQLQLRLSEARTFGLDLSAFSESLRTIPPKDTNRVDESIRRAKARDHQALNPWTQFAGETFAAGSGYGLLTSDGAGYIHISAKQIQIYDLATRNRRSIIDLPTSGLQISSSPDRTTLAATGYLKGVETIRVYDLVNQVPLWSLPGAMPTFSADGKQIAYLADNGVRIVNASTGEAAGQVRSGYTRFQTNALEFTADGSSLIVTGGQSGVAGNGTATANLHIIGSNRVPRPYNIAWASSIARSSDGRIAIVSRSGTSSIRIFRKDEFEQHLLIKSGQDPIQSILFSPDGRTLVGAAENQVFIWDADTGILLQTLDGVSRGGRLTFSEDGHTLAVVSNPGMIGDSVAKFFRYQP